MSLGGVGDPVLFARVRATRSTTRTWSVPVFCKRHERAKPPLVNDTLAELAPSAASAENLPYDKPPRRIREFALLGTRRWSTGFRVVAPKRAKFRSGGRLDVRLRHRPGKALLCTTTAAACADVREKAEKWGFRGGPWRPSPSPERSSQSELVADALVVWERVGGRHSTGHPENDWGIARGRREARSEGSSGSSIRNGRLGSWQQMGTTSPKTPAHKHGHFKGGVCNATTAEYKRGIGRGRQRCFCNE